MDCQVERNETLEYSWFYVLLNRLIKYGYLESGIGESSSARGGKAKKYYKLTKDGILALIYFCP